MGWPRQQDPELVPAHTRDQAFAPDIGEEDLARNAQDLVPDVVPVGVVDALVENPDFSVLHRVLAASLGQLGRICEARAAVQELMRLGRPVAVQVRDGNALSASGLSGPVARRPARGRATGMTATAELEARLEAQRDSGVARVSYDGRSMEYRGIAEIAGAIAELECELQALQGTAPVRQIRIYTSKGSLNLEPGLAGCRAGAAPGDGEARPEHRFRWRPDAAAPGPPGAPAGRASTA